MIKTIQDISDLLVSGFTDWGINVRTVTKNNLTLFNYTAAAQYEGNWNYFERVSRGLIIDNKTGEIVARPFDKFFNWGERGLVGNGSIKTVLEKRDGSLGILYRDNGYKIATRGSFESTQAIWATEFLNNLYDLTSLPNDITLLFEIIYPENRIVVDYGGLCELTLLAIRDRFSGEYWDHFDQVMPFANKYRFSLPLVYSFNDINEIIKSSKQIDANTEGWVVEMSDGSRWKFKGDQYVEVHRLISSLSFKNILVAKINDNLKNYLEVVPDEFLEQVHSWLNHIESKHNKTKNYVENMFSIAPKSSRKEFALWIQENCPDISLYLFMLLDGKNIDNDILKRITE